MTRVLLCLAALAACSAIDTLERTVTDHGTVYVCESGAACPGEEEWCWQGSEHELEQLLGATCHEIRFSERAWPALVGCAYCCDSDCPRGANSHCGSFCPDGAP